MGRPLYSHRQRASLPRDVEVIDEPVWTSFRELMLLGLKNQSFARAFPRSCGNCKNVIGTNEEMFEHFLKIEIPRLDSAWKYSVAPVPDASTLLDLIEIMFRHVSKPEIRSIRTSRCRHRSFVVSDVEAGRVMFTATTNFILDRERLGFYLDEEGQIKRVGAPVLSELITEAEFNTDDEDLDELLGAARNKFISRDLTVRREGLEKLWDAWERLKTLEPGKDKKSSVTALLDQVAEGPMRERLETEARELTDIGNQFMIRHSETDRHSLDDDRHVDYLFHRMFSLVYLLLDGTGRVGRR